MNILLILGAALLHRMLLERRRTTGLHDLWCNIDIQFKRSFLYPIDAHSTQRLFAVYQAPFTPGAMIPSRRPMVHNVRHREQMQNSNKPHTFAVRRQQLTAATPTFAF